MDARALHHAAPRHPADGAEAKPFPRAARGWYRRMALMEWSALSGDDVQACHRSPPSGWADPPFEACVDCRSYEGTELICFSAGRTPLTIWPDKYSAGHTCERYETRPRSHSVADLPALRLAVTRGSRSAKPEDRRTADLEARHDGRPYIEHRPPLAVVRWRQASGPFQEAERVTLIVVAKASGTTRRFSLAMGTPGTLLN